MYSKFLIPNDHIGRRLDNFVVAQLKIPKSLAYKLIRKGAIKVLREGKQKKVAINYKLMQDDSLYLPEALTREATGRDFDHSTKPKTHTPLLTQDRILFENSDYIIIDKPFNLAVQGGSNIQLTLLDMVQNTFNAKLYLAHRLDRATSGCILFSKNYTALRHFHAVLASRKLIKKYIAIVSGNTPEKWSMDTPIIVNEKTQNAVSQFSTACTFSINLKLNQDIHRCALIWASPISGRKHQLRIHLQETYPILGDDKYGNFSINKKLPNEANGLMLHAHSLSFHDLDGNYINVKSPLPTRFNKLFKVSSLSIDSLHAILG